MVEVEYQAVSGLLSYQAGPKMTTFALTADWNLVGTNDAFLAKVSSAQPTTALYYTEEEHGGGVTAQSAARLGLDDNMCLYVTPPHVYESAARLGLGLGLYS